MNKQSRGLGRGLDALIPTMSEQEVVKELPINDIVANKYQPRNEFDEEALDELAESIFGKRGSTFTIGKGIINFVDYSKENLKMYLDRIASVFTKDFPQYFPESKENVGLYHKIGDILELISKLKYLLSQK